MSHISNKKWQWRDIKTLIEIDVQREPGQSNNITVNIYPEYPNLSEVITCKAEYIEDYFTSVKRYRLWDIFGNRTGSNYDSRGYGTLLLNTVIQVFHWHANQVLKTAPTDIFVFGETADVDDPEDQKEFGWKKRTAFYQCFNFKIKYPNTAITPIERRLSELTYYAQTKTIKDEITPRYVDLSLFWHPDSAPSYTDQEALAIKQFDMKRFDLSSLLSFKQIDLVYDRAKRQTRWAVNSSLLIIILLTLWAVVLIPNWVNKLNVIVIAVMLLFMLEYLIRPYFHRVMPAYKQYKKMDDEQSRLLSELREFIETTEDRHNGLLWRVGNVLKDKLPEVYAQMSSSLFDRSRQIWWFAHPDDIKKYFSIIDLAQQQLALHQK